MLTRHLAFRWFEFRRRAPLALIGLAILIALARGFGTVFPSAPPIAAAFFLGSFFALGGAPDQIVAMRRDKTVIHLMPADAPARFTACVLVVDAIFALPMMIAVVAGQTAIGAGVASVPDALKAALGAFALSLPFGWALCCFALWAPNAPNVLLPSAIISGGFAAIAVQALDLTTTFDDIPSTPALAYGAAYLATALVSIVSGRLLLTWWRQGGDIFL